MDVSGLVEFLEGARPLDNHPPARAPSREWGRATELGIDANLVHVENPGTSPRRRRLADLGSVFDDDGIFRDLCEQASSPTLQRISAWGSVHLTRHDMPRAVVRVN